MKRSIEALVAVPMLLVIVAMAILGLCGIARAEPWQRTQATLFAVPRCPASGRFSAQLLATYAPPIPNAASTVEVPCPPNAP